MQSQIAELEEKVKRNDNRMAQMYTDKLDGIITVEEFTKYRESYQKESLDIEKRIEILKSKLVALSVFTASNTSINKEGRNIRRITEAKYTFLSLASFLRL